MSFFAGHYNYIAAIILLMAGLYIVISSPNLIKKILGLNIFQNAVFLFYISLGKIYGGTAPILTGNPAEIYSNPLPHVLILTAIVVGIATMAVGLALAVRIRETYGEVEEDAIARLNRETDRTITGL